MRELPGVSNGVQRSENKRRRICFLELQVLRLKGKLTIVQPKTVCRILHHLGSTGISALTVPTTISYTSCANTQYKRDGADRSATHAAGFSEKPPVLELIARGMCRRQRRPLPYLNPVS
jgi:hypothetical protein